MEKIFEGLNAYAKTIKDGVELDKMEFKPLQDFRGQVIRVEGFFFTTGNYGKQVVVVGNGCKINMPSRAVESFEVIAKDEKLLNALLEGHLQLTNIREVKTKNGTTTAYEFTTVH